MMMIGLRSGRTNPPILVIRRKIKSKPAARSETWKLAYADFVTALMALFSVLWVLSSNPGTQKTVGAYFHGNEEARHSETALASEDIDNLAKRLQRAIQLNPELGSLKMQVRVSSTREGLRVDLFEKNRVPLFATGREDPTQAGAKLLKGIARELGKVPNRIAVEGHTDSRPYSERRGYTNWELSIDRANAARRVMSQNGLRPGQVSEVFGSADQNPRLTETAEDSENRRVTLIVKSLAPL
jgi:chemotaxis protein MotB